MERKDPQTRDEIIDALSSVEEEVESFFSTLSLEEFFHREGDAWNAAEHLTHLNQSVAAVARGLTAPKLLLRLRFGRASGSRGYDALRRVYLDRLQAGARATGRFVPTTTDASDLEGQRREILDRWARLAPRLRAAVAGWSEKELDRIRAPHPALGLITIRELLFFTVYHNLHHVAGAKRRLPRFQDQPAAG